METTQKHVNDAQDEGTDESQKPDIIDAVYHLIETCFPSPIFELLNAVSFAIHTVALKFQSERNCGAY